MLGSKLLDNPNNTSLDLSRKQRKNVGFGLSSEVFQVI